MVPPYIGRVGQAPPYISKRPPLTAAALDITDVVRGHFVAYFQTAQQGASVKAYWI